VTNDDSDEPSRRIRLTAQNGVATGPPPPPITTDDLYRAILLSGESEEDARQLASDLGAGLGRPGVFWVGDLLLWVALLSPDHEERIRTYLRLDREQMAREVARVRAALAL